MYIFSFRLSCSLRTENRYMDKAGVINASFTSVFNTDDEPRRCQYPKLQDHDCENDQLPTDPDIMRDLLLPIYGVSWASSKNPQRVS